MRPSRRFYSPITSRPDDPLFPWIFNATLLMWLTSVCPSKVDLLQAMVSFHGFEMQLGYHGEGLWFFASRSRAIYGIVEIKHPIK